MQQLLDYVSLWLLLLLTTSGLTTLAAMPELCSLDAEQGPCKALIPRFFYNASAGACGDFIYGGCQGNDNNFGNLTECERTCAPQSAPPPPPSPNDDTLSPLSNNNETNTTNNTTTAGFDGVDPNNNGTNATVPLTSAADGVANATVPTNDTITASGQQPVAVAPGETPTERRTRRQADQDGGTVMETVSNTTTTTTNNVTTNMVAKKDDVNDPIATNDKQNSVNITASPNSLIIVPPANSTVTLDGANNNSTSITVIDDETSSTATTTTTEQTTTPSPTPTVAAGPLMTSGSINPDDTLANQTTTSTARETVVVVVRSASDVPKPCLLAKETGPCRALFKRFYYNPNSGACETFVWGGCDANANNFESASDCNEACLGQRTINSTDYDTNNNSTTANATSVVGYRSFTNGDGGGEQPDNDEKIFGRPTSMNNELDTAAARLRLRQAALDELNNDADANRDYLQAAKTIITPPPREPVENDLVQPAPSTSYGFGSSNQVATNTGGSSESQTKSASNNENAALTNRPKTNIAEPPQPPLKCQLQQMTGPCEAQIKRYFFNTNTMRCEPFVYGGCYPNANNFESQEQCAHECTVPTNKRPAAPATSSFARQPPSGSQRQQQLAFAPPPSSPAAALMMPPPQQQQTYYLPQPQQPPPLMQQQQYGTPPIASSLTAVRYTSADLQPPPQQVAYYQPQMRPMQQQQQQFRSSQPTFGSQPPIGSNIMNGNSGYSTFSQHQPQAIDWRAATAPASVPRRSYRHIAAPSSIPAPRPSQLLPASALQSVVPTLRERSTMLPTGTGTEWRATAMFDGGIGNVQQQVRTARATGYDTS